jgi:hypothetical protein
VWHGHQWFQQEEKWVVVSCWLGSRCARIWGVRGIGWAQSQSRLWVNPTGYAPAWCRLAFKDENYRPYKQCAWKVVNNYRGCACNCRASLSYSCPTRAELFWGLFAYSSWLHCSYSRHVCATPRSMRNTYTLIWPLLSLCTVYTQSRGRKKNRLRKHCRKRQLRPGTKTVLHKRPSIRIRLGCSNNNTRHKTQGLVSTGLIKGPH